MADDLVPTVVTKREDTFPASTTATTPGLLPNVPIIAMPWWQIVLVRTARVYLQSLSAFVSMALTGVDPLDIMPETLGAALWLSAQLALAPATLTLIQNALELLAKLDMVRPTLRA